MKNPQFIYFVNALAKKTGQYALCEAIKKGYAICEGVDKVKSDTELGFKDFGSTMDSYPESMTDTGAEDAVGKNGLPIGTDRKIDGGAFDVSDFPAGTGNVSPFEGGSDLDGDGETEPEPMSIVPASKDVMNGLKKNAVVSWKERGSTYERRNGGSIFRVNPDGSKEDVTGIYPHDNEDSTTGIELTDNDPELGFKDFGDTLDNEPEIMNDNGNPDGADNVHVATGAQFDDSDVNFGKTGVFAEDDDDDEINVDQYVKPMSGSQKHAYSKVYRDGQLVSGGANLTPEERKQMTDYWMKKANVSDAD